MERTHLRAEGKGLEKKTTLIIKGKQISIFEILTREQKSGFSGLKHFAF